MTMLALGPVDSCWPHFLLDTDDIVLLATSLEALTRILTNLHAVCEDLGLEINFIKTEVQDLELHPRSATPLLAEHPHPFIHLTELESSGSHMIDRLETVHNCFLRQWKGIEPSLDRIISTADHERHAASPHGFPPCSAKSLCHWQADPH
eukprot:355400-Chlamydomonas_euryale.AAC.3